MKMISRIIEEAGGLAGAKCIPIQNELSISETTTWAFPRKKGMIK